jgi:hypothetical protein
MTVSISSVLFEQLEQGMTLSELYEGELPASDELIWNYFDLEDFEQQKYKLIKINPVVVWNTWKPDGETVMKDVYKLHATKEQKRYVNSLRKKVSSIAKNSIVVVYDNTLLDGNHRIAALAQEKNNRSYRS